MADENNGQGRERKALAGAIEDAQRLLAYAASTGIEISTDIVKMVVSSPALLRTSPTDPGYVESEAKFWSSYNALVKIVKPVTAASLKESTGKKLDKSFSAFFLTYVMKREAVEITAPELSVRQFRRWALFSLFLLLLFQVYWVIGNTVISQITPRIEQIKKLEAEKIVIMKSKSATAAEDPDVSDKEAAIETLTSEITARLQVLQIWNSWWSFGLYQADKLESPEPNKAAEQLQLHILYASFSITALQLYLLPLLYGLLGACLFVLRSLAKDLKALTYSAESPIQYKLRLYMGSLAGLVFAWFLPAAGSATSLTSLGTFAVAFLAGYSVELLFAFLDKIIDAFSSK